LKTPDSFFSQVALSQDLPEYNLKEENIGTIVEQCPMPDGEDGYSLVGFDVPQITIELTASQMKSTSQLKQCELTF
jgi:hypothetical protein